MAQGGKNGRKNKKILLRFKHNKHIFNLSHGILPHTPIVNVERTIKLIRISMKPDNHIFIPKKIGVLMVNLGTPEDTNYISMWFYLREFLSDKRIIELTRFIWFPILYFII